MQRKNAHIATRIDTKQKGKATTAKNEPRSLSWLFYSSFVNKRVFFSRSLLQRAAFRWRQSSLINLAAVRPTLLPPKRVSLEVAVFSRDWIELTHSFFSTTFVSSSYLLVFLRAIILLACRVRGIELSGHLLLFTSPLPAVRGRLSLVTFTHRSGHGFPLDFSGLA